VLRWFTAFGIVSAAFTVPAQAQIFWHAPDLSAPVLVAPEPGFGVAMPGATPTEQKAALVWNLRSGLNVAALQCGFDQFLKLDDQYNIMLVNHREELAAAFSSLTGYFNRTAKSARGGQSAIDTYGTRTYSQFSSVSGQLTFCSVAGQVARAAIFAPRGKLNVVAQERLRELYSGVKGRLGEQQFRPTWTQLRSPPMPDARETCWKSNKYTGSCGWTYF
jgi:hypothetical protein